MTSDRKISLIFCCTFAAIAAPTAAQEPIGRLFFTPAQRLSLDVARTQRARAALSTENTEDSTPVAQSITYGGLVRRSDGRNTVWLNNRAVNDQEAVGGANIVGRVRSDGGVTLQVPQSGRSVVLKPGQSVELLTGAVEEAYSRKPPAAKPEVKPETKPGADSKTVKPAAPDAAKAAELDREEQDQYRLQDAIRAVQDAAGAKPSPAPPAETPR